ncbi:MAG: LysR family transcriptional regulator [Byssovorax sp.]
MDLAHLRYFQAIAKRGSMTAAARDLNLSQPTLTVAVRNLEEKLGTKLFLRNRSGVTLTSTGRELLHHTAEIFSLIERAEERIQGLETDEVGSFVIGCHESLGAYFLPTFMSRFLRAAPKIELSLSNASSSDVADAVVARQVDFGLVVNPRPHPELVCVNLFHDAMDIVVASSSRAEGRPDLAAAHRRLREGPLIFAGRVSQCQELVGRLSAEGLLPPRLLSCGDLELVKSLALENVGVALLPRRVAAYGQPGKLARLHPELPFIPDVIALLYRADLHRTRAAIRLKDALIAHGRALDAESDA